MHDRLSRWTPAIFAAALANFLLAQALLISGLAWPEAPLFGGPSLAMVHLLTIGWLTLLMFGALFQFVPVITQQPLLHQNLSLAALLLIECGLAAMIAGFLLLGHIAAVLLPAGGATVFAGVLAALANLAVPLARKHPWPLSIGFVASGFCFLIVTVLLGFGFALALTASRFFPGAATLLAAGVENHALAGLGGWFTLTAMGVSYELLPMFMLSPHERGAWGLAVLAACLAGFVAAIFAGIAPPFLPASIAHPLAIVEQTGRAFIGIGVLLYLLDVVRLYRARRRRQIELHNRAAVGAFAALALCLLLGLALVAASRLQQDAPALVLLVLFGWLSGLGLTQLYKIVPFLAWLSRFGRKLGKARVPRVQDLVNEQRALPLFITYFAGVALALAATLAAWPLAIRLAACLTFIATLLLTREYWRAWRAHYAQGTAGPSLPISVRNAAHDHDRAARA